MRSQIAQNLESLTDKAKDPAVRSDAMKLLDGAKPEDRAGMIDKMATLARRHRYRPAEGLPEASQQRA